MNWNDEADDDWVLDWMGFDGSNAVDPYGPAGVGTFALDLESGFKVRHKWPLDLHKFQSGKERRISRNDAPQESFDGSTILLGTQPRAVRAQLARYASQGSQFLFGLPHEQLFVSGVSGSNVTVIASQLALTDWAKPGQRCVVTWVDSENVTQFSDATIQSVSSPTITVDISPDARTSIIMPARPVYFDSQQSFPRYPTDTEVWQLVATAAIFDFAPTLASLALDPLTVSAGFNGVIMYAREFGAAGNTRKFSLLGIPPYNTLSESDTGSIYLFEPSVTTLAQMFATLASSAYVRMGGTFNGSDVIAAGDQFAPQFLTGAALTGDVGTGATIATYAGDGTTRLVWDRPITVEDTVPDQVQALTQIVDHGALSYALGTAERSDFGRAIAVGSGGRDVWQWLKKFLATTLGPQKAFWLPTWRNDLTFVSKAANTVTVSTTDGSDFSAWWPLLREHIQIVETSGTITRAKITAAVDNGDGTRTLTIGTTLASSNVSSISWLELCRFEGNEFEFSFGTKGVSMQTAARVVQQ